MLFLHNRALLNPEAKNTLCLAERKEISHGITKNSK